MWDKGDYYIVGLYEEMVDDIYPTHFTPIIAERKYGLYRRWNYIVKKPYEIELKSPVSSFKENHEDLFPVKTMHYVDPIKLNCRTQVIGLGRDRILASDSKAKLVLNVATSVLTRWSYSGYLDRAMITLRNIVE
ncbi:hypothetical protein D4A39_08290 [Alcanivorax profundi]|uniref:Uncharacterized protein n=1 Tax=Alcanivorax profundi TaxID=2338368 RepID=A0A418XZL4_9GAMM|nr:hypothetical protein D4A39_08290 [Alcanivorax profundi]